MIGKVQDAVSAAAVFNAVTQNGSTAAASRDGAAQQDSQTQQVNAAQQVPEQEEQKGVQDAVRSNAGTDEASQKEQQISEEDMTEMMKELNKLMDRINCNLHFKYHKEVDVMSVKMVDKRTNEVIKEMPPEEMVEHMIQAKEWLGAFIDKQA